MLGPASRGAIVRDQDVGRTERGSGVPREGSTATDPLKETPPTLRSHKKPTCQQGKEALAASAVPDQQGVGGAAAVLYAIAAFLAAIKLHVDALRAQSHIQVAQLADGVAVAFLQPLGQLVPAMVGRRGGGADLVNM